MRIQPLHELFTTKEDRLAVYKLLKLGYMPKKSGSVFHDLVSACEGKEIAPTVASVATKDKMVELSEKSGVSLLSLKQALFCSLLNTTQIKMAKEPTPFLCKTVEEIDKLGKETFGSLWGSKSGAQIYSVAYAGTSDALTTYKAIFEKCKLKHIGHPFVYPESLPVNCADAGAYAVCTDLACIKTGRNVSGDWQSYETFPLKDYLNGKPLEGEYNKERAEKLERFFYANLVFLRSVSPINCYIHIGDDHGNIQYEFAEMLRDEPKSYVQTAECWDAYKRAFTHFALNYDGSRRRYSRSCKGYNDDDSSTPLELKEHRLDFTLENCVAPFLKGEWRDVLTDVTLFGESKDEIYLRGRGNAKPTYRLYIYERVGEDRQDKSEIPVYWLEDYNSYHCQAEFVQDIPEGVSREELKDVLYYTGVLIEEMYGSNPYKKFPTRILVTSPCYVSALTRAGAELYFAFKTKDAEGSPLVLYVDNEEDAKLVEEHAAAVGASLKNGKNKLVLLKRAEVPDFPEAMRAVGDVFANDAYIVETLRATLLARMFTDNTPLSGSEGYVLMYFARRKDAETTPCLLEVESDNKNRRLVVSAAQLHNLSGDSRCSIVATRLGAADADIESDCDRSRMLKDELFCLYPAKCLSYSVEGNSRSYGFSGCLPLVTRGGYCRLARWEEIPELAPNMREAWEYVNSLSMRAVQRIASAAFGMLITVQGAKTVAPDEED